jgi:hypothetical protein
MSHEQAQAEIMDASAYYRRRGWEWLSVVDYLSARALGTLPMDVIANLYKQRRRAPEVTP